MLTPAEKDRTRLTPRELTNIHARHPVLKPPTHSTLKTNANMLRTPRGSSGEDKVQVFGHNKRAEQCTAEMINLASMLKDLESEIVHDTESCKEMRRHVEVLTVEKEKIEAKIAEEEKFIAAMADEKALGGVMKQFQGMNSNLQKDYHVAREKHKRGMKLLKDEFGYHQAYRLGREGEFTATYFTPAADPNKKR